MYNYFMLMGRVAKEPEIKELNDGRKVLNLRLAVSRGFKNTNGEIECDFFSIAFWEFLVDIASDRLKKGQPVVVKGRMQTNSALLANGYNLQYPILIGERIMFFDNNSSDSETSVDE